MAHFVSFEDVCELQEKLGSVINSNLVDIIVFIRNHRFFLSPESTFDLIDSLAFFFNANIISSDELSMILIEFHSEFTNFFQNKYATPHYLNEANKYFLLHFSNMDIVTLSKPKNDLVITKYFSPELKYTFHHLITSEFKTDVEFFQLRQNGCNHFPILEFIRNDDFFGFQDFLSENGNALNLKIPASLFERFTLLNKQNVSLIEYSAFFKAIQIFKFLYLRLEKLPETLPIFAVAGGDPEIISLCQDKGLSFRNTLLLAIQFKHDNIYNYLRNEIPLTSEICQIAIEFFNCSIIKNIIFEIFQDSSLVNQRSLIKDIVKATIISGHISLFIFELDNCLLDYAQDESFTMVEYHRLSMLELAFRYITDFDFINKPSPTHRNMRLIDYSLKKDMTCFLFLCGLKQISLDGLEMSNQEPLLIQMARLNKTPLFQSFLSRVSEGDDFDELDFDINIENSTGETALHIACLKGNLDIVKLITSFDDIDINHPTLMGQTPLHYAARQGSLEVIAFLVTYCNAHRFLRDCEGLTPAQFAMQKRHMDAAEFLSDNKLGKKKSQKRRQFTLVDPE